MSLSENQLGSFTPGISDFDPLSSIHTTVLTKGLALRNEAIALSYFIATILTTDSVIMSHVYAFFNIHRIFMFAYKLGTVEQVQSVM